MSLRGYGQPLRWFVRRSFALQALLHARRPGPGAGQETAAEGARHQAIANTFWDTRYRSVDEAGRNPEPAGDPIDYTRHAFLYAHAVCAPLTGDPGRFWLDEIAQRFLAPPAGRALALGCGTAEVEEHLVSRGYADHVIAYDASAEAITLARRRLDRTAWGRRIELRCADPLRDALDTASFDLVFVEAAIHHFLNIDDMLRMMHRVLKPGGLLIFDEYVGPDHHQYPPDLVELLNRVNACLAEAYRRDYETGEVRDRIEPAALDWMLANDPSEGVHASRILPLTYQLFDVLDRRDYGGAIMRPLFGKVLRNWDFTDPKDQTVARLIILLEQELTRHGVLPHHNTMVVATPKPTPAAPLSAPEIERIGYADWPGRQHVKNPCGATSAPAPRRSPPT